VVDLLENGSPIASGADAVQEAAVRLQGGAVVAIPTDTVYGLAARIDRPDALADIFRIKGRPDDRPLPILVDGHDTIGRLLDPEAAASPLTARLLALAGQFWPGGLTVALLARADLPGAVLAPDGTAGFRIPADPTALHLLGAAGGALAVTSANRSGEPTPADPQEIADALRQQPHPLRWVLADGFRPGNAPSTVIGVGPGDVIIIHRQGAIAVDAILAAWEAGR
jgi:L-threonylcarbamoyladenylate synthase